MSASKPIENNDLPLIDVPGYDINERIETYYEMENKKQEILREWISIERSDELHLKEFDVSIEGEKTTGYCLSEVIHPDQWQKVERFMVLSENDNSRNRIWMVIYTKEGEVEKILEIPKKLTVEYRSSILSENNNLGRELIEWKIQFFRHIREYFKVHRRFVKDPVIKETCYPIKMNRDSKKFYYTVGTFRESLANNKGSWWIIDKKQNAILYVFNYNPKTTIDRSGDYKLIPDTVMHVKYDEVVEKIIKIIGFDILIRKNKEMLRLYPQSN